MNAVAGGGHRRRLVNNDDDVQLIWEGPARPKRSRADVILVEPGAPAAVAAALPSGSRSSDTTKRSKPKVESPIKLSCVICREKYGTGEICAPPCGHIYCIDCIRGMIRNKNNCGVCRKSIKEKAVTTLYF